jgi:hypothetical protein
MTNRVLDENELALIYSPSEGLRLELPENGLPIEIEGALLASVFVRLSQEGEWAEELKRWTMAEVPRMSVN